MLVLELESESAAGHHESKQDKGQVRPDQEKQQPLYQYGPEALVSQMSRSKWLGQGLQLEEGCLFELMQT